MLFLSSIFHNWSACPREADIHFGGERGKRIRENYLRLTQQVQVKKGTQVVSEQRKLFPHIDDLTSKHTFRHPEGLLFATQFSQPALVLVELSAFRDMQERGLIPDKCVFAGHSLGEYAALASVASVLSVASLVDVVFLRGMTMQNAVQRDEQGRSQYAMVAVNTSRVHATRFREPQLQQVLAAICAQCDELLQVVNFNVENYQYVVAGERGNLHTLGLVLNDIKKDPQNATGKMPEIIKRALAETARIREEKGGWVPLDRTQATIPLPGIDVPFHSHFLKSGVPAFRDILRQRMVAAHLDPDRLVGCCEYYRLLSSSH